MSLGRAGLLHHILVNLCARVCARVCMCVCARVSACVYVCARVCLTSSPPLTLAPTFLLLARLSVFSQDIQTDRQTDRLS